MWAHLGALGRIARTWGAFGAHLETLGVIWARLRGCGKHFWIHLGCRFGDPFGPEVDHCNLQKTFKFPLFFRYVETPRVHF